eukprot:TRINITY_DN787_c1_g1_i1.p1 TRINITY_DN787_c1_g1~~TRINITY_DN787_c1_g1_i1.p1  ORF type:complete len:1047 (-),score=394.48 TRINITY_DN787_c1_g1_i1:416-3394(-)
MNHMIFHYDDLVELIQFFMHSFITAITPEIIKGFGEKNAHDLSLQISDISSEISTYLENHKNSNRENLMKDQQHDDLCQLQHDVHGDDEDDEDFRETEEDWEKEMRSFHLKKIKDDSNIQHHQHHPLHPHQPHHPQQPLSLETLQSKFDFISTSNYYGPLIHSVNQLWNNLEVTSCNFLRELKKERQSSSISSDDVDDHDDDFVDDPVLMKLTEFNLKKLFFCKKVKILSSIFNLQHNVSKSSTWMSTISSMITSYVDTYCRIFLRPVLTYLIRNIQETRTTTTPTPKSEEISKLIKKYICCYESFNELDSKKHILIHRKQELKNILSMKQVELEQFKWMKYPSLKLLSSSTPSDVHFSRSKLISDLSNALQSLVHRNKAVIEYANNYNNLENQVLAILEWCCKSKAHGYDARNHYKSFQDAVTIRRKTHNYHLENVSSIIDLSTAVLNFEYFCEIQLMNRPENMDQQQQQQSMNQTIAKPLHIHCIGLLQEYDQLISKQDEIKSNINSLNEQIQGLKEIIDNGKDTVTNLKLDIETTTKQSQQQSNNNNNGVSELPTSSINFEVLSDVDDVENYLKSNEQQTIQTEISTLVSSIIKITENWESVNNVNHLAQKWKQNQKNYKESLEMFVSICRGLLNYAKLYHNYTIKNAELQKEKLRQQQLQQHQQHHQQGVGRGGMNKKVQQLNNSNINNNPRTSSGLNILKKGGKSTTSTTHQNNAAGGRTNAWTDDTDQSTTTTTTTKLEPPQLPSSLVDSIIQLQTPFETESNTILSLHEKIQKHLFELIRNDDSDDEDEDKEKGDDDDDEDEDEDEESSSDEDEVGTGPEYVKQDVSRVNDVRTFIANATTDDVTGGEDTKQDDVTATTTTTTTTSVTSSNTSNTTTSTSTTTSSSVLSRSLASTSTATTSTSTRNVHALNIVKRVKEKLEGIKDNNNNNNINSNHHQQHQHHDVKESSNRDEVVSVSDQVDWIIKEATSLDNLSKMYEGWTPWV